MSRLSRLRRRLLGASVLLVVPIVAAANGWSARLPPLHTALKRSEPARDTTLAASPERISLWFTARPELAFSRIQLDGPSGRIQLDPIAADTGNALHARIPRPVGPGSYRVVWQTASADGHPIRGAFAFTVLAAANALAGRGAERPVQAEAPAAGIPSPLTDPVEHAEYRSARWMEFVALLTILGVLGFRHGVLPPLASRGVPTTDAAERARRLGQGAIILYVVAAVVRLFTEAAALRVADAVDAGVIVPLLTRTTWGVGWLVGMIGAALLLLGWVASRRSVTIGTPLALTGALGLVLSPALSGHAAASRNFVLSVTLDVTHVAAAGIWIGGLLIVLIAGIPAMKRLTDGNQDAAIGALVSSFHPVALFCAPIVVLAGLGTSWIRLGSFPAAWSTEYGRTLLLKLALFALVAGMGMYNALRARKRLGIPEGTRHFRVSGAIELVFAAAVLAATTFLVSTPVPTDMAP